MVFNRALSRKRVAIDEHCFGILESRSQSLNGHRLLVNEFDDLKRASRWIIACAVFHNFLLENNEPIDEGQKKKERVAEADRALAEELRGTAAAGEDSTSDGKMKRGQLKRNSMQKKQYNCHIFIKGNIFIRVINQIIVDCQIFLRQRYIVYGRNLVDLKQILLPWRSFA